MIRLLVECHKVDDSEDVNRKDYVTLDVDIPELEKMLTRGGYGEGRFETWRLIGAEVMP